MNDKKTPPKPVTPPRTRTGAFNEGSKVQKSLTTQHIGSKIGKPKPDTGK
ncbi:hypothetical protein [Rhizobium leguminosarum]|nr:hypothetical protein [Rhizobium leguminosarum]MBY5614209.1 hypothetical protein [Rhizobium leguminosarum]